MASDIAATLRGKKRPSFTPSMPAGDFVVVVNAAKVEVSGDTREKKYYRHTMYPGGLRSISQEKLLATRRARHRVRSQGHVAAQRTRREAAHRLTISPAGAPAVRVNAGKGKTRTDRPRRSAEPRREETMATSERSFTRPDGGRPPSRVCGSTQAAAKIPRTAAAIDVFTRGRTRTPYWRRSRGRRGRAMERAGARRRRRHHRPGRRHRTASPAP